MQDRLKRWIMGHQAYGASSSCSVPKFPPNLSCAAFSLVSNVGKKKSEFCVYFVFFFICTFVHTHLKSSTTSETNSSAAEPSHTSCEPVGTDSRFDLMHNFMWATFE